MIAAHDLPANAVFDTDDLSGQSKASDLAEPNTMLSMFTQAGVALGVIVSVRSGVVCVDIQVPALQTFVAMTMMAVVPADVGRMVALAFAGGDSTMPVVLGFLFEECRTQKDVFNRGEVAGRKVKADAYVDGERVLLEAAEQIELRCGDAAIVLSADGRIELRGTYVTSQASVTQRILGGSVNVN